MADRWLPTSEAINALPDGLRDFIHDLESRADPAGDVRGRVLAEDQVRALQAWVNDLQAGMYINCVYCGHRYGPDDEVPASMADVLKAHVEQCPKHPMSALKAELEYWVGERDTAVHDMMEVAEALGLPLETSPDQLKIEAAEIKRENVALRDALIEREAGKGESAE